MKPPKPFRTELAPPEPRGAFGMRRHVAAFRLADMSAHSTACKVNPAAMEFAKVSDVFVTVIKI